MDVVCERVIYYIFFSSSSKLFVLLLSAIVFGACLVEYCLFFSITHSVLKYIRGKSTKHRAARCCLLATAAIRVKSECGAGRTHAIDRCFGIHLGRCRRRCRLRRGRDVSISN